MGREVRARNMQKDESLLTRILTSIVTFIKYAEFEIFFVLFFVIAFFLFRDLTARPEYNQLLVKKPGGPDFLPY